MIGTGEIIVILCVVLLLFGGKKLPEFARNLGRGIKEFKKACSGLEEHLEIEDPKSENLEDLSKIEKINPHEEHGS
jgi:sec-independent protein translocase protein TatA